MPSTNRCKRAALHPESEPTRGPEAATGWCVLAIAAPAKSAIFNTLKNFNWLRARDYVRPERYSDCR
jgi:hypothetical protein